MDRGIWWTPRAWCLHLTLLVTLPTFLALCWWQVDRALSGNDLSWAYVFEWPFFAGYAVYLWWRLVHEPRTTAAPAPAGTCRDTPPVAQRDLRHGTAGAGARTSAAAPADDELAAYNRYLAELEASGRRKHW